MLIARKWVRSRADRYVELKGLVGAAVANLTPYGNTTTRRHGGAVYEIEAVPRRTRRRSGTKSPCIMWGLTGLALFR
jgi:ribosomal protein S7